MTTASDAPIVAPPSPKPETTSQKVGKVVTSVLSLFFGLFLFVMLFPVVNGWLHDVAATARAPAPPALAAASVPVPIERSDAPAPWAKFEDAAWTYLKPCRQTDDTEYAVCQLHRQMFVRMYVLAMSGETMWIDGLVKMLGPRTEYQERTFSSVPNRPVEACAWRTYAAGLSLPGSDQEKQAKQACGSLAASQRVTARRAAETITHTIDRSALPPLGWRPDIDRR